MLDPYIRLKEAVILDKLSIVKLLLRRYPDLLHSKDANNNGWSLLHYASYYGNYLVCVFLIQLGCDSNYNISKDFTGKCAIHLSILKGDEQTCHLLLQHFPKTIEYKDFEGNSPLLLACKHGHYRILTLLITCTANIKDTNNNGDNGLHISLENGHLECCRILLQYGLHDDVYNNAGLKPSDVAFTFDLQKKFIAMTKEVVPLNNMDILENKSILNNTHNTNLDNSINSSFSDNSILHLNETANNISMTNPISDAIGNPFKSTKTHTKHSSNNLNNTPNNNLKKISISTTSESFPTSTTKESYSSMDITPDTRNLQKKNDTNSNIDDGDVDSEGAVATPLLSSSNNKMMFPFAYKNDSNYSFSRTSLNQNDNGSIVDSRRFSDSLSLEEADEDLGHDELTSLKSNDSKIETRKKDNKKRQSLLATVPISKVRNLDIADQK